jgi:HEAT repeat protein
MELGPGLSAEETIADLGDRAKPLLASRLVGLSNLSPDELKLLGEVWATIEPKRRRQIVYRLVELAEDSFELNFDDIFRYCLKDEDSEVKCKAIEGLWESEEPSLVNLLIELLERDSSADVQAMAASALGNFAMLAEQEKLRSCHKAKICQALFDIIDDQSRTIEVRRRALEAAAPLSLPEVSQAIRQAYQSHNHEFKVSAIYAMGRNCDPAWLPILLKELASADAEMRYEAVVACGEMGNEGAVATATRLVNDPDTDVQLAAIQALGKIGGTEAKNCLEECQYNSSEAVREAARQALTELETWENPLSFG